VFIFFLSLLMVSQKVALDTAPCGAALQDLADGNTVHPPAKGQARCICIAGELYFAPVGAKT
jgi:hypothetical protein